MSYDSSWWYPMTIPGQVTGFASPPQQGWQCPACKIVWAPWFPSCSCSAQPVIITNSGASSDPPLA